MTPKRILVTGAAGFTGRYFLRAAGILGYECIAVSQNSSQTLKDADRVIECDLLDFVKLNKVLDEVNPDYIVHLAAISFVRHGSAEDIYRTNIVGTTNLLDATLKQCPDIEKVLVVSSGNVYGNADKLPITEQTVFKPENDYGVSKCSMELAIKVRMNDLPIVVTRPFNYTGVGQAEHFLVPKIVNAFKKSQRTIELGNLDVARDFSDVRDVVTAYLELLRRDVLSECFNVCSGHSISLLRIIGKLNSIAGYDIEVSVNEQFIRGNEIKELYGNEKKLRDMIGMYRKYNFDDTLKWMYSEK